MKNYRVVSIVLLVVLLCATPAFAATQLTRFHSSASFNNPVGAQFIAYLPCVADWSSWGTTSNYKEIIQNWDDCEEGEQSTTCWIRSGGVWTQVNCP